MTKIEKIVVSILLDTVPERVGELVLFENKIYFKYDAVFLDRKINISPFKLPFHPAIAHALPTPFEGLFGVFDDSLPDGWGRLLLDRYLQSKGINPLAISPLDRLAYVGRNGRGALLYEPVFQSHESSNVGLELDAISKEMHLVLEGESTAIIDELFLLGGSSGGARPKINVGYHSAKQHIISSDRDLPEGYEHWIVKFSSSMDRVDAAQIEYAYHKMALQAGLQMMPSRLFQGKSGQFYFGTQRFDRNQNKRIHTHTASGLLHDDFKMSTLDYGHLMDAGFQLEKQVSIYEKILRLAAFNLYSHNRDDHSKNFSFLMDENGLWRLAPVYDLTFSSSSMGSHSTSIAGSYKNPTSQHLLELAQIFGIKNPNSVIEQVKDAVSNWEQIAKVCEVTSESIQLIQKTTAHLLKC